MSIQKPALHVDNNNKRAREMGIHKADHLPILNKASAER